MNDDSLYCGMTLIKNNIAMYNRTDSMKEILFDVLRFLAAPLFVLLCFYLRYESLESRVKDLGDGGIQTIFGDQTRK